MNVHCDLEIAHSFSILFSQQQKVALIRILNSRSRKRHHLRDVMIIFFWIASEMADATKLDYECDSLITVYDIIVGAAGWKEPHSEINCMNLFEDKIV